MSAIFNHNFHIVQIKTPARFQFLSFGVFLFVTVLLSVLATKTLALRIAEIGYIRIFSNGNRIEEELFKIIDNDNVPSKKLLSIIDKF